MRGKSCAVNAKMTLHSGELLGGESQRGEEVGGERPPHHHKHERDCHLRENEHDMMG